MFLGDKLRELREKNGLMQRQVGAVIEVDGAYISKVENNEKPLNRKHLKKLSRLFKVDELVLQELWLADKIYKSVEHEPTSGDSLKMVLNKLTKYSWKK